MDWIRHLTILFDTSYNEFGETIGSSMGGRPANDGRLRAPQRFSRRGFGGHRNRIFGDAV